jgi:DNA processing protein
MRAAVRAIAMSFLPGRLRFDAVRRVRDAWGCGRLASDASPEDTVAWLLADVRCRASGLPLVEQARRAIQRATAAGISAVAFTDAGYPALLGQLGDAPPVLWVRGCAGVLGRPAVAVVGSRAASAAGVHAGRRLAEDLAAAGVVVISGLARGVDAAAHDGAVAAGHTIAVLGSGVDVVYPAEHAALAGRIAARGALVSEFPPGTAPRRHHFPLRNRIISGLSVAVVVVEAADRSGALITARLALDQGREVMAMPGPVAGGRNRGAHGLIRDGALLVESADDVLNALAALPLAARGAAVPADPPDAVLGALAEGEEVDVDALARRTGLEGPALLARVSHLEVEGSVQRVPGGRILRLARKW